MQKLYIHPLPVRIWHWTNASGFIVLLLTGLQIRYAGPLDIIPFRLAVEIHNWVGFVLIGNFFVWLLFYLFSDKIGVYHPELRPAKYYRESFRQARYYAYGIFKGEPNPYHVSPYHKFNPLQSMTYQIIMLFLVPVQFFTGLLLWDVTRFAGAVEFFGGVRVVDTVHVLIFTFFVWFIFVHVYLATLGHSRTAHIKAMVTGYEEVETESTGEPGR